MRNDLTPSELRTLKLIANGHGAKEASEIVGLSPWTIKDQVKSAIGKIGARNAAHAVALAFIGGIIRADETSRTPPSLRQTEALSMIASGYRAKQIADKLFRSQPAIRDRLHWMYSRIGARNAPHAVAIAMTHGWIKPEDLQ